MENGKEQEKLLIRYQLWEFNQEVLRVIREFKPKNEKERIALISKIKFEFTERKI